MNGTISLNQHYPSSRKAFQFLAADHELAEATKFVRSVETAIRTGQGDSRSNAVILQLLALANAWIDLHRPFD